MYWIGQAFGLLATIACVLNPIFKKKWQMLTGNLVANLFLALNLVFLNRIGSGIFLFCVAIAQSAMGLVHARRDSQASQPENILFLALYLGLGFYGLISAPGFVPEINRQNLLELLPIAGAVMSMCFVAAPRERTARRFLLACNSIWLVYHGIIRSTSVFGAVFSVITGIIAICKEKKENAK